MKRILLSIAIFLFMINLFAQKEATIEDYRRIGGFNMTPAPPVNNTPSISSSVEIELLKRGVRLNQQPTNQQPEMSERLKESLKPSPADINRLRQNLADDAGKYVDTNTSQRVYDVPVSEVYEEKSDGILTPKYKSPDKGIIICVIGGFVVVLIFVLNIKKKE